ncbi:MAG TPA: class I SAM-dependent methyltransferase [Rubrivivax sp.]|nr:class I SAM-dependent methyltransferase [Rubrivivax sp.]
MKYPHTDRSEIVRLVPKSAQRLLDVGCNSGAFGEALKRQRPLEIWGVEPNTSAAKTAETHLDRVLVGYFDGDCAVPDGYFDIVVFNDVLEHMVDPAAALTLGLKKLREGGQIIVSLPNLRHIDNLLHILVEADFRYEDLGVRDRTHLRFFTRRSALRFFDDCGLETLHVEGVKEQWYSPKLWRRLMFRLLWKHIEDTRFVQFAFVLRPSGRAVSS